MDSGGIGQMAAGQTIVDSALAAGPAGGYIAAPGAGTAQLGLGNMLPWLSGASMLASLAGTAGQTKASVEAANARAAVARLEAESIRQKAAFDEQQARRRALLIMGKTRAITAAGGVDLSRGSPLFVDLDNTRQMEIEALNIRRSGELGASAKEYEATLAKSSVPGTILAGAATGTGSILSSWLPYIRNTPRLTLKG